MFNNKKKTVSPLFFRLFPLLLCIMFLISCSAPLKGHEIVGVWEHAGSKVEFTDKGKFIKGKEKYDFSLSENKITIDNNGEAMVIEYSLNSNGTLTMNGLIYYPVRK